MGGLTEWIVGVVESLGAVGVGLLVLLETLIPPIPSEIVLAMAGYLAAEGRTGLLAVFVAATTGSVTGALALYWLGHKLGTERLRAVLDRIPLIDRTDLDRAERWFEKYGQWTVLFGRMVPVVRSLVSIPAGAERMPLGRFVALTTLGSGVWNALLIGAGYTLGEQWQDVERYTTWFDIALLVGFGVLVAAFLVKRLRRVRARR